MLCCHPARARAPRHTHLTPSHPPPQLYAFLARRTDAGFNGIVAKRLTMSRVARPPMGLARISKFMKAKGAEKKIAVAVATITDDIRLEGFKLPALKIAALRFTAGARARIVAAGGECLTLDQLALLVPTGANTILLRGRKTARTANKYFGNPGTPGSSTRPKIESKGRKFEKARGRRASRGFKVCA